jgi:HPt (histidine-containing phosphotransfer) domain-containing protein
MEKGLESSGRSWQDITVEMVHELIGEDRLQQARLCAAIRAEALQELCKYMDDAMQRDTGDISPEEWQKEKEPIVAEITELKELITSIDIDTQKDTQDE